MSFETLVWPSTRRSQASGLVASSAPADEQLALEAQDELGEPGEAGIQGSQLLLDAQLGPRRAERRDGLVDRAVGLGPDVVLLNPRAAEEESRAAVVALARGDD